MTALLGASPRGAEVASSLYGVNRTGWVVIGIVGAIAALVAVLTLGGDAGPGGAGGDAGGDVSVGEGPNPPSDASIADIVSSDVRKEGDAVVFEATMEKEIPSSVKDGSLEFRWDLAENGTETWLVTASINVEAHAAITSQKTAYGSSTIDGSMPGHVEVDGNVVRITVTPGEVEGFPSTFTWTLKTTLDGVRSDPGSGTATDSAPDDGPGSYSG